MRKAFLAFAMTSAAAFSVMVPGTALAIDHEYDYGVLGGGPSASARCAEPEREVQVCYERSGDKWWVLDRDDDRKSAIVEWRNYRDDRLYRVGRCTNSRGAGTWASCNKNYYEDSEVKGHQGYWDRSAGDDFFIHRQDWKFQ